MTIVTTTYVCIEALTNAVAGDAKKIIIVSRTISGSDVVNVGSNTTYTSLVSLARTLQVMLVSVPVPPREHIEAQASCEVTYFQSESLAIGETRGLGSIAVGHKTTVGKG